MVDRIRIRDGPRVENHWVKLTLRVFVIGKPSLDFGTPIDSGPPRLNPGPPICHVLHPPLPYVIIHRGTRWSSFKWSLSLSPLFYIKQKWHSETECAIQCQKVVMCDMEWCPAINTLKSANRYSHIYPHDTARADIESKLRSLFFFSFARLRYICVCVLSCSSNGRAWR